MLHDKGGEEEKFGFEGVEDGVENLFNLANNSEKGIVGFHSDWWLERLFTKSDLYKHFNITDPLYWDTNQAYGGIFLVKKNELLTPPISSGCLSGVMRKRILQIASSVGLNSKESTISVDDLLEADEVFLTNSISGIRWVGAFRKKRYFHNWAKKLVEKI